MNETPADSPTDAAPKRHRVSRRAVRHARSALAFLDGHQRLDGRTWQAQFLEREAASLASDLGGDLSHQQRLVVALVARQRLLVEMIDAWLFQQHPVNRGKRALLPVVRERQAIVDGLARMLSTLGLERRAKRAPTLAEVIEQESTP